MISSKFYKKIKKYISHVIFYNNVYVKHLNNIFHVKSPNVLNEKVLSGFFYLFSDNRGDIRISF